MTTKTIPKTKTIPELFGLTGDGWLRHANPASVWTRFAALPLLALAVWSRDWIGWLALAPVVLPLVWLGVNPLFFRPPRSTDHWASKAVLGEHLWTQGNRSTFPREFRSAVPGVAQAVQVVGLAVLGYGLVVLDPVAVVAGLSLTQVAKLWYLDRMVLLYDARARRPGPDITTDRGRVVLCGCSAHQWLHWCADRRRALRPRRGTEAP